jgi:hypothetical protein
VVEELQGRRPGLEVLGKWGRPVSSEGEQSVEDN